MENKKQKQIRKTAKKLFWKFGIRRVTIEEICDEAGASKGTFYKYFSNKEDLLKYIFDFIFEEAMSDYRKFMAQEVPFEDKIEKIIKLKLDLAKEMSPEFFDDFYKNSSNNIQKYLEDHVETNMKLFMEDLKKAQKKGEIRQSVNIQFVLFFVNHIVKLVTEDELGKIFKTPREMVKGVTEFFFYGIMSRNERDIKR